MIILLAYIAWPEPVLLKRFSFIFCFIFVNCCFCIPNCFNYTIYTVLREVYDLFFALLIGSNMYVHMYIGTLLVYMYISRSWRGLMIFCLLKEFNGLNGKVLNMGWVCLNFFFGLQPNKPVLVICLSYRKFTKQKYIMIYLYPKYFDLALDLWKTWPSFKIFSV